VSKVSNAALKVACEQMLTEGISYDTMDCQKAVEEALNRCGIPKSECDLAGSNAHYRKCRWVGTPEECLKLLGVKEVPTGAFMFIWEESGAPSKYDGDGMGNATHIGVYLGGGRTFNSSQSMGSVTVSTKFGGKKTVPNGGWNRVGFSDWVDCGLTDAQLSALGMAATSTAATQEDATETQAATVTETATATGPEDTSEFVRIDMEHDCKGNAVRRLQKWLNCLYLNEHATAVTSEMLTEDGEFGPKTDEAVRAFQEKYGLTMDGVVGRNTWAKLAQVRYENRAVPQG
jgi:hypothetical protein